MPRVWAASRPLKWRSPISAGRCLGKKIVLLTADHQNKPDVGASKFREWSDQSGLNMLIGGSNTGVNIAMAKVAAAKKVPLFVIGAGGASLTNEDCTAYTVHYVYDTTALANGTASTIVKSGGKTWFYLTADYAFGSQLQNAASKVVEANGGKNLGAVRAPLASMDFSSFLFGGRREESVDGWCSGLDQCGVTLIFQQPR